MARSKWQGVVLAGVATIVMVAGSAMAAETSPHKGWFVGGTVSGGGELVRGSAGPTVSQNRFGGGAGARFGYGVTDQVLLMLDNSYFYSRKSATNFNTYDGQLRVQIYPVGNFYLATGGGLAAGQVLSGLTKSTKIGLSTTTTAGYEVRPKDQLGIGIEGGYNYRRLDGENHHSPIVAANLHFYF